MPRARSTDVRLRVGTWPAIADVPAATYGIINFAVNSDQSNQYNTAGAFTGGVVVPWAAPVLAVPAEYTRVWIAADFSANGDGFKTFTWLFSYLTFDMMNSLRNALWPGDIYSNTVTVVQPTWLGSDSFLEWLHATAYKPVNNAQYHDFDAAEGGYDNVKIRFDAGVVFTPV